MVKQLILGSVVALGLVMSGCASKSNKSAGAGAGAGAGGVGSGSGLSTSPGDTGGAGAGTGLAQDDIKAMSLVERSVYFEFDSVDLDSAGQTTVARVGRYLAANPTARVRLEGHADERGTREYNVGLGERRANAVQSALLSAGATAAQLALVSYGEERPADPGHDEAAWAKNRRVEIMPL